MIGGLLLDVSTEPSTEPFYPLPNPPCPPGLGVNQRRLVVSHRSGLRRALPASLGVKTAMRGIRHSPWVGPGHSFRRLKLRWEYLYYSKGRFCRQAAQDEARITPGQKLLRLSIMGQHNLSNPCFFSLSLRCRPLPSEPQEIAPAASWPVYGPPRERFLLFQRIHSSRHRLLQAPLSGAVAALPALGPPGRSEGLRRARGAIVGFLRTGRSQRFPGR